MEDKDVYIALVVFLTALARIVSGLIEKENRKIDLKTITKFILRKSEK